MYYNSRHIQNQFYQFFSRLNVSALRDIIRPCIIISYTKKNYILVQYIIFPVLGSFLCSILFFLYKSVYKSDDGSQLEPKHVVVNKLIKLLLCVTVHCLHM